jgi:alpha-L-rhamnosidase
MNCKLRLDFIKAIRRVVPRPGRENICRCGQPKSLSENGIGVAAGSSYYSAMATKLFNDMKTNGFAWAMAVFAGVFCFIAAANAQGDSSPGAPMVTGLRCDELVNPLGVDFQQPVLSWRLSPGERGRAQSAYEILVTSSSSALAQDTGDVWDSGRVKSSQSIQVSYAGKPLVSGGRYFWKVRVWDEKGNASDWSEPAFWTMGLLNATDWQGKWIGLDEPTVTNGSPLPARWLRKEFDVPGAVARATVYFSGLGWSELYINGQKVGDHVLSPPLSQYPKREYYETYEVGPLLQAGGNVLGVVLGNGRFYAPRANALDSGFPKLLLQLHIEFADGTTTNIVSDESWRLTTNGPITANNEYDGEQYDAQKELTGWSSAGFADTNWQAAEVVSAPGGVLCGMRQNPIRVIDEIKPVAMNEISPGVYIFDLGQNMVGWCKIKVQGPAGTRIALRHAETLDARGELFTNNLRSAKVMDTYVLKGGDEETWQPRFTLHGFRYVELTGYPGTPTLDTITGCVVGDDLPVTGEFECSNPLINQIHHNVFWGVRGNYRSIPTDCPQRDERQGWLGDRAEENRGESYLFDNDALYAKWQQDMADSQNTEGSIPSVCPTYWKIYRDDVTWAGTSVFLPGMLRDQFGDKLAVAQQYECAKKWIEHMEGYITNGIIRRDTYGDWCMPPEDPGEIHSKDPARITHAALLATPFFYHDLRLMQSYALQLGKKSDARHYGKLADKMKKAFNQKYLNRQTGQYENGTPTSSILPLAFGMVPDNMHEKEFEFLTNKLSGQWKGHISTGLVGAKYLMRVLTDNGRADLAYTILTQTNYPSWGYMIAHGATTIWELWNGNTADPGMNSGNHVMLIGDLGIWLYEDLAGIKPDPEMPGFKHIIMRPVPVGDLKYVKAAHLSPYGWVRSEWHKNGNEFDWHVEIPANTTATLYLLAASARDVTESGVALKKTNGVKYVHTRDGRVVVNVESGEYDFVCKNTE